MQTRAKGRRALICCHDSAGLGHLRFCRTLAHGLRAACPDLSVLILSGSPAAGQLEFAEGVDFLRVPGLVRRGGGRLVLTEPATEEDAAMKLREAVLRETAAAFAPDLVIVDHAPLGRQGEIAAALSAARDAGARLVLALRDVLDDPQLLAPEWQRMAAVPALDLIYDQVWIFGTPELFRPLSGLDLPPSVARKLRYAGYPEGPHPAEPPAAQAAEPFLLVATGGGDGAEGLVDWVLSAYEHDRGLPFPAVIALGPFADTGARRRFAERAAAAGRVRMLEFVPQIERLIGGAAGIVGCGSYSLFSEILGYDKPALLVPRLRPGRGQLIRAVRAEQLGLARMLLDPLEARGRPRAPAMMAEALRALPHQQRPSVTARPGLLDGGENLAGLAAALLNRRR